MDSPLRRSSRATSTMRIAFLADNAIKRMRPICVYRLLLPPINVSFATGPFNFRGPDVDRLVKGRERIYLDRFYNELSADPSWLSQPCAETATHSREKCHSSPRIDWNCSLANLELFQR